MTSNLSGRGGRNSDLRALKQRCFHEGVAEFLAGMPLREIGCVADQVYYEYGRLFAARLVALGYAVPKLPTRGDFRRADFRAALDAFHQAMIVDDTFASPFLGLFRQAR